MIYMAHNYKNPELRKLRLSIAGKGRKRSPEAIRATVETKRLKMPFFKAGYSVDGNGCWIWKGSMKNGYGVVREGGRSESKTFFLAHKFFYEKLREKVPEGKELDHLCRNKACINPEHLEPVSHKENVQRGSRAKLNSESVSKIREMYDDGKVQQDIADIFGIAQSQVSAIVLGKCWN